MNSRDLTITIILSVLFLLTLNACGREGEGQLYCNGYRSVVDCNLHEVPDEN